MKAVAETSSVAYGSVKPGLHILHNGRIVEVEKVEYTGSKQDRRVHVVVNPLSGGRRYAFSRSAWDSTMRVKVEMT